MVCYQGTSSLIWNINAWEGESNLFFRKKNVSYLCFLVGYEGYFIFVNVVFGLNMYV